MWRDLVAVIGEHDIIEKEDGEQVIEIEDHLRHPYLPYHCTDGRVKLDDDNWKRGMPSAGTIREQYITVRVGSTKTDSTCADLVWNLKPTAKGAFRQQTNGSCFAFYGTGTIKTSAYDCRTCFMEVDTSLGYDMAILVLKKRVDLNGKAMIAKLPYVNEDCIPLGKNLTAGGCGYGIPHRGNFNSYQNRWSRYLWAVKQQCVDVTECDIPRGAATTSYLCVGDLDEPRNSECIADSGGPLTYNRGQEIIIFGVLHGHGKGTGELLCRTLEQFARVSEKHTINWIKEKIGEYR